MPKVDIDYSNTIFYKIFCKDPTIKELYVGLTTNFVQRKHAHKQSCKNEKSTNYNCKLYNVIRNTGGWNNWQMEIIAFHNCKDSYEAHKKEQEYFEMLGATLNSIEPLPKPKIKEPIAKIVKEKTILYCEPCNIHFSHWKAQETHNNTQKHHKMITTTMATKSDLPKKFRCDSCYYYTSNKKDYDKHLLTLKHQKVMDGSNLEVEEVNKIPIYLCECSKTFKTHGGLWKHKKKGCFVNNDTEHDVKHINNNASDKDELINYLIKENQEFKSMILELVKKDSYNQCTTNNNNNNTNTLSNNNSNNKTFNLNFFLNETCKDAMNMKDFIQSLEMSLPELEKMGEVGFAEGMSLER